MRTFLTAVLLTSSTLLSHGARADDCSDGKGGANCVNSQYGSYQAASTNYNNWAAGSGGFFSSDGVELAGQLLQLGTAAAGLASNMSSYNRPVTSTYGQGAPTYTTPRYRSSTITGIR